MVGGGLGGLSAAGFLARAGLRVLLVERAPELGGCVRALEHGGHALDPAVSAITRGVEDELSDGLLEHLGARNGCAFVPVEGSYRADFPGRSLEIGGGRAGPACAYGEAFPGEREAVNRFFAVCERMLEDAHRLPLQLSYGALDDAADRFPTFFRYRGATLAEVLDEHFSGPRPKAAIAVTWPWAGLPPSRLSFATFAQGTALLTRGSLAPVGSFRSLVAALASAFEHHGGEILVDTAAKRIVVERGRVCGLELDGGCRLDVPAVVSNADAIATFEHLLVQEVVPDRLLRRVRRSVPSLSAVVVLATTRLDLSGVGANTFLCSTWDAEESYRQTLAAQPAAVWATVPTVADPSVAAPGRHVVALRALAPDTDSTCSPRGRDRYTAALIAAAARAFPGFDSDHNVLAVLTPADLAARTGNTGGAMYGWENTPGNTGSRRLPVAAPVGGLYLAGHWTQPGHGVYRALLSGMHAARALLGDAGAPDAIPDFRSGS